MTAIEWFAMITGAWRYASKAQLEQAKEMEKEQRGYSEEDVRKAYQQGEEDSYLKGGQTKEMENEFIQSLKQSKSK